jgi:hypothetical protein
MLTNANKDVITLIAKTNNNTLIGNRRPFTFLGCVYVTLVKKLHDFLLSIMKFNCRKEEYPW